MGDNEGRKGRVVAEWSDRLRAGHYWRLVSAIRSDLTGVSLLECSEKNAMGELVYVRVRSDAQAALALRHLCALLAGGEAELVSRSERVRVFHDTESCDEALESLPANTIVVAPDPQERCGEGSWMVFAVVDDPEEQVQARGLFWYQSDAEIYANAYDEVTRGLPGGGR